MSRLTARHLQQQVTELRNLQSQNGPAHSARPVPSLKRAAALEIPVSAKLRRTSTQVQAQNALSLGRPAAGLAWSSADSQEARHTVQDRSGPLPRSLQTCLTPCGVLKRRVPAEARKIANKRVRARRRQRKFEDRLRASMGEMGVLHRLSMGRSETSYRKRVDTLWAFMSKHGLPSQPPARMDEALSDYADWAYLAGEKAEHGEKLKAALAALHPLPMPPGKLTHPLFDRAMRGWRKASPTFARIGYPEGVSYAISGQLLLVGRRSMALFNVTCFSTYLRPSSAISLRTIDLIPPPPGGGNAAVQMWTLLVSPTEREVATKTGEYDMAVVLDDTRETRLGEMLQRQQECMLKDNHVQLGDDEGQVPMWDFSPAAYVEAWREAVKSLGLDHVCSTPYQARHGGPSRDLQSKLRTEAEVAARGWWKSGSSVRNYAKPSRMNKVAQSAGSRILEYGEHVRQHFAQAILDGTEIPLVA